MDENRRRILDLMAEGKITPDEAERLMDRLGPGTGASEPGPAAESRSSVPVSAEDRPIPKHPKFLRVVVDSANGDKVNVRVPTALIRTGIKMTALIPQHARQQIEEQGIDLAALQQLDTDELVEALAALTVDVEANDGTSVRVFCE